MYDLWVEEVKTKKAWRVTNEEAKTTGKKKMSKNRNIYMIVTEDKYELPLFVGTAKELAEHEHITISAIYSAISNHEHGRLKTTRFRRVRI